MILKNNGTANSSKKSHKNRSQSSLKCNFFHYYVIFSDSVNGRALMPQPWPIKIQTRSKHPERSLLSRSSENDRVQRP